MGAVSDVTGRQQRGKQMWYEVTKVGRKKNDTQWFPLEELEDTRRYPAYVRKLIKNYDQKQQAVDSGTASHGHIAEIQPRYRRRSTRARLDMGT